jgi:hypothetical protein
MTHVQRHASRASPTARLAAGRLAKITSGRLEIETYGSVTY